MRILTTALLVTVTACWIAGCGGSGGHDSEHSDEHGDEHGEDAPLGEHGGQLLADGDFVLELLLLETAEAPQYRAWASRDGALLEPQDIELNLTLRRLGGVTQRVAFYAQGEFLRSDTAIYEPHSYEVDVVARHGSSVHRWQFENFEGRTRIGPEIARAFGLEIERAGPASIRETVSVYGRVAPDAERVRQIYARFAGALLSVEASVGDRVRRGQTLATVESNESLARYSISAPIDGVITERYAHPGEQTGDRTIFALMDTARVWVEFAVFPSDLPRVRPGQRVTVIASGIGLEETGEISYISPLARPDQSVVARVTLENPDGALVPGMYVTGEIEVAVHEVALAVKRDGLQSFRDFTVVFAQFGDQYEVRMLEMGQQGPEWVEVLGGLDPGTPYVSANSYLVKADIEKSGASHDH